MRNSGFTLVELMVVLAIMAILATVVGPPIMHWIADGKLRSAQVNMRTDLQMVKSKGIRDRVPMGVEFNGTGYTIFLDDGSGGGTRGNTIKDNDSEIAFRTRNFDEGITVTPSDTIGGSMGFDERGNTTGAEFGTLTLSNGQKEFTISITIAGNISTR